jgi:hypothetical protein
MRRSSSRSLASFNVLRRCRASFTKPADAACARLPVTVALSPCAEVPEAAYQ